MKGLRKLMIVQIDLYRDIDNPQIVFESLNSTGLQLSQVDLVRNYVLMSYKEEAQTRLYKQYWLPMEQLFFDNQQDANFNNFLKDYLIMESQVIIKITNIYNAFKEHIISPHSSMEEIENALDNMLRYARYFSYIMLKKETNPQLKNAFEELLAFKNNTFIPMLMPIYNDYMQNIINVHQFIEIIHLIRNYFIRRGVCGLSSNVLTGVFANLYKKINDTNNYLNNFKLALYNLPQKAKFPNDEEFKNALINVPLYKSKYIKILFNKLENYDKKEHVNIDNYTIEHIMPQKLNDDWKATLGDNWQNTHNQHLHTLGNLTLSGYNTEYSNNSYHNKRTRKDGFLNSPLRLNQFAKEYDIWNQHTILQRAQSLAQQLINMYPSIDINPEIIQNYQSQKSTIKQYTIKDYDQLMNNPQLYDLYHILHQQILHIDPAENAINLVYRKYYVNYQYSETTFLSIIPLKNQLKIHLNISLNLLDDPKQLCEDITNVGKWSSGDTRLFVKTQDDFADALYLIRQSFTYNQDF